MKKWIFGYVIWLAAPTFIFFLSKSYFGWPERSFYYLLFFPGIFLYSCVTYIIVIFASGLQCSAGKGWWWKDGLRSFTRMVTVK